MDQTYNFKGSGLRSLLNREVAEEEEEKDIYPKYGVQHKFRFTKAKKKKESTR